MGDVKQLDDGVEITYRVILPILVALGVVGSAGSIAVLHRPGLLNSIGNKYFLALSYCDLFLSVSYINIAVTACGCVFNGRASAWFFAHFGWTITCTFHAIGTYIIIFMSLDRFVAVWFPVWYKPLTQPPFDITKRLVIATLLCFGLHLVYMVDAEVQCVETSGRNCTVEVYPLDNCTTGTYISNDGFQKSFNKTWHEAYRYIYNMLLRWLPCILLIFLNFGLVLAVVTGKVKLPRSKEKEEVEVKEAQEKGGMKRSKTKSKKERVLVATAIAMTASYVVMTLPITIFLTVYAEASECRCEKSSGKETLRHVGNTAQLLEHVLHSVYLFLINPCFRQELLYLLQCKKSPNDEVISSKDSGRPLSSVSRSSTRASRKSMVPVQLSKPSRGKTVEVTLKECKPLGGEATEDTLEKYKPLSSETIEETLEEYKPLYSETSEETFEKSKSLCSDTEEETSEEPKSQCSNTEEEPSLKSKSQQSDTEDETLEDSK